MSARTEIPAVAMQALTWLRAAEERGAVGGRLDRVGVVLHRAGDDGGLAAVADTGATRPADWHVARFCELEQTGVFRTPGNSEVGVPAGMCGDRDGAGAMPGVWPGAGPKSSTWMRPGSRPSSASVALVSLMNDVGPQR